LIKNFLIVCLSFYAVAVSAAENRFYVGLGPGLVDLSNSLASSTYESGLSVIEGGRRKVSETNRYDVEDDTSLSYRAFGGYSLNDNVSLEVSFHDFGDAEVAQQTRKTFSDGSVSTGSSAFALEVIAVSVNALVSYPLNERVSLYTNVGGAWSRQERHYETETLNVLIENGAVLDFSSGSSGQSESESHFDFTYGFGASIQLNEFLESRLSVSGVELSNGRVFDYGLSLVYRI
jgi:opacity protein-like surface antigen